MNILKNNWLRAGLSMIVLLLGVFFVVRAMEKEEVVAETPEVITTTTYYYNGPSSGLSINVMNHNNWDITQDEAFTCDPEEKVIPCSLEVPDDKGIQQFLQDLVDLAGVQGATLTRRADAE